MKKTSTLINSNIIQRKTLSIVLIILLTFLAYNILPTEFNTFAGILNGSIPIFTIFFSGYVFQYGLKKVISKIIFVILLLFTFSYLYLYWYVSQL